MEVIPAKTILSSWKDGKDWFGINYNMNLYKGCCHGCIYCDSRSACYGVEDFERVRAKENALPLLERDLKSKRKPGIAGMGSMSDPYNPFEAQLELTRGALKLAGRYGYGLGLATKSDLVTRDIDLLLEIQTHAPAFVNVTVTTFDDGLCARLEPYAPVSSRRLAAVRRLSGAGVTTGVLLMPLLPFINDTEQNVAGIVRAAAESGARYVYPAFGVTLRQNQRDYYYTQLDRLYPGLKQEDRKVFGDSYACGSPRGKQLWQVFREECGRFGLAYRMPEIIPLLRGGYGKEQQMSFF